MLNCREASFLASKNLDTELTRMERAGLWLHYAMCSLCRRYARELKKFHALFLHAGKTGQVRPSDDEILPAESRARIKKKIDAAIQGME